MSTTIFKKFQPILEWGATLWLLTSLIKSYILLLYLFIKLKYTFKANLQLAVQKRNCKLHERLYGNDTKIKTRKVTKKN